MEKELFKAALGELVSIQHEGLTADEVIRIAMGAVTSFATQHGIELNYIIKDNF